MAQYSILVRFKEAAIYYNSTFTYIDSPDLLVIVDDVLKAWLIDYAIFQIKW